MEITGGKEGGDKPPKGKRGRKPGRRARIPTEIKRDRRELARLRFRFHLWTQDDFADELNERFYKDRTPDALGKEPPLVSRVWVSNAVKELEERLDKEAVSDTLRLRRLRIAEYRDLEAFCYERYKATVGEHTKTVTTSGKNGTTREELEVLSGERGYLELAERCKHRVTELEGIEPPRKIAPTNPDGTKPYDAFTDSEELKRLRALYDEIEHKTGG